MTDDDVTDRIIQKEKFGTEDFIDLKDDEMLRNYAVPFDLDDESPVDDVLDEIDLNLNDEEIEQRERENLLKEVTEDLKAEEKELSAQQLDGLIESIISDEVVPSEIIEKIDIDSYRVSHQDRKLNKLLKQLKKCTDIKEMLYRNNKITLKATNGEMFLIHAGQYNGMINHLKSWIRRNTSLQTLKI